MGINDRELRRRKKVVDDQKRLQKMWDKLLTEEGLSMSRGMNEKMSYVGTSNDLAIIEKLQTRDSD